MTTDSLDRLFAAELERIQKQFPAPRPINPWFSDDEETDDNPPAAEPSKDSE